MDSVSFVIATYKRPDALRCTLEALRLQRHEDWEAIVVGDACGPETEATLRTIGDPRIAYYNLPERCGEQSGPNSVGLALARGEVVTFLNHDDLLLPDHLTHGLDRLVGEGANLFIGKAANATRLDGEVPVFTDVLPRSEDVRSIFLPPLYVFDPSSFWLVRTDYARRVGSWRSAATLWRTPLDDWLLRAWRLGGTFVFGERITGLRLRTHHGRTEGPLYDHGSLEHDVMLERMRRMPPDDLRAELMRQIDAHDGAEQPDRRRLRLGALAGLYRTTGFDALTVPLWLRARGRKGHALRSITRKRTGTDLPDPPDVAALVARAATFRVL